MSTGFPVFDTTVQESNPWLVETRLSPCSFAALGARLDPGEILKLIQHLPNPLPTYWPSEHQVA